VFNSAMIVFREGLEAVLIFAAVTASFQGANRARRRPRARGEQAAVRAEAAPAPRAEAAPAPRGGTFAEA
jgi:high-affinity iron transporter